MNFKEYQKATEETANYPSIGKIFIYPALGVNGEVGELADKVIKILAKLVKFHNSSSAIAERMKKLMRDKNGIITEEEKEGVKKELGDILYYAARICTEFNIDLHDVATTNIEKLRSRKSRGKISGEGDNR